MHIRGSQDISATGKSFIIDFKLVSCGAKTEQFSSATSRCQLLLFNVSLGLGFS